MPESELSKFYEKSFCTFTRNIDYYNLDVPMQQLIVLIQDDSKDAPRSDYFQSCQFGAFTENDRMRIVDWYIEITNSKRLPGPIVFRATNLLDRYLSRVFNVSEDKSLSTAAKKFGSSAYIFVAMACFDIAAKVEGCPSCLRLFQNLCELSNASILYSLEITILSEFGWCVMMPTCYTFIDGCLQILSKRFFCKGSRANQKGHLYSELDSPEVLSDSVLANNPPSFSQFCTNIMSNLHLISGSAGFLGFSYVTQACAAIYVSSCTFITDKPLRASLIGFLDELKERAGIDLSKVQRCGQLLHRLRHNMNDSMLHSQQSGKKMKL